PVADGNYDMTFQIYDLDVGGASVWGPQTITGVAVEDGLFSVNLGGAVTLAGIDFNKDCWLQTTVGVTTYTPRQLLTAVTYALFALSAPSGSIDHGALTGLGDDDHAQYLGLSRASDQTITTSNLITFSNTRPVFNGGTSGVSSPFTVDSDQKVVNLNADQLDNFSEEYFFKLADNETVTGKPTFAPTVAGTPIAITVFDPLVAAPVTVNSSILVTNLNADKLDGQHGSYYAVGTHTHALLTRGTGLTGSNYDGSTATTWAVAYGSTAGTAVQGNQTLTVTGTNITVGGSPATLGAGSTITLTSANSSVCKIGTHNLDIGATYQVTDTCPANYCAVMMLAPTTKTGIFPEGGASGRGSYPQVTGASRLLCCRCDLTGG
ncbi:MAG: hypothetical protein V1791_00015, partial [Pseudomonadota bacterium]